MGDLRKKNLFLHVSYKTLSKHDRENIKTRVLKVNIVVIFGPFK